MTAHVGKAIGGERHLSSPGSVDPDALAAAGGSATMAPYSRSRDRSTVVGESDVRPPKRTRAAVGRQAPVVEQVPGVEEHAPVGVDRGGERPASSGFGGDHVAPDGKDRAGPATARAGDRSRRWWPPPPPRTAVRPATSRARIPGLVARIVEHGGGPLEHGTRRVDGAGQTGRQLGGVEPGAALDEQSAEEPARPDLVPELRRRRGSGPPRRSTSRWRRGRADAAPTRGWWASSRCAPALPVEFDAELGPERTDAFEGGHGLVPEPSPRGLGEELRDVALATRVRHAAVATARPGPDVVPIEDDDVATRSRQLQRGGQAGVPASHHGHVDRRRQRAQAPAGAGRPRPTNRAAPRSPGSGGRFGPWRKVRIGHRRSTTRGARP